MSVGFFHSSFQPSAFPARNISIIVLRRVALDVNLDLMSVSGDVVSLPCLVLGVLSFGVNQLLSEGGVGFVMDGCVA